MLLPVAVSNRRRSATLNADTTPTEPTDAMLLYEVTLEVEPEIADAIERYMRDKHIPEIFATGCFRGVEFARTSAGRFRTAYAAATQDDLDRYLREHAPHFRDDFVLHFPSGATPTREVWSVVQRW